MATVRVPVDGLSKLAYAIGSGGNAYQNAYNNEAVAQSRIGQAIASMRKDNAQAAIDENILESRSPDAIRSNAMAALNIPTSAAQDVADFQQDGYIGRYNLPATQAGPTEPAPEWTKNLGNLGRLIATTQNAITLGDKNSENVAKSYGLLDNLNKQDQVIAGTLPATKLGEAVAAAAGKPLFKAQEYGVLNEYTGDLDTDNAVARRFGAYRDSETGKNRAQATASYASADNSRASARQHDAQADFARSKIGQGQTTTLPDGTVVTTAPSGGASGAKPGAEVQRQISGILSLDKTLDALDAALKDFDPRGLDQFNTEKRARIRSIAKQAQLDAKEAAALGALSGPDMDLLEGILADPTTSKGVLFGEKGISAQIAEAKAGNRRRLDALQQQYPRGGIPAVSSMGGSAASATGSGVAQIQNDAQYNALPSGTVFIGPDGKQRRKP